jgi:hypothetical protein
MPGEYQDPNIPANDVRVDSWPASGKDDRAWYKPWTWRHSEYVVEKHTFNRFEDEEVPTLAKRREEKHPMGIKHEMSKDGKCWTMEQFEVFSYVTRHFIKKRWVEYWAINKTLEDYYAFVDDFGQNAKDMASGAPFKDVAKAAGLNAGSSGTGPTVGTVIAGAAVAGPGVTAMGQGIAATAASGLAAAGTGAEVGMGTVTALAGAEAVGTGIAAVGTAATAIGTAASATASVAIPAAVGAGVAVITFVGTTEVMKKYVEAANKISEGWEFVSRFEGPEELERQAITMEQVGPTRDCPPPKKKIDPPEGHWTTPFGWLFGWLLRWWWVLVALLILILVAVGVLIYVNGGGSTPTPAPAEPAAVAPGGASAVVPVVAQISSTLAAPVTTYSVTASDPGSGALTYQWAMTGEACGTPGVPWKQTGQTVRWSHSSDPPDNCTHKTPDHAVVATVTITTSKGVSVQCSISGTETNVIAKPACK